MIDLDRNQFQDIKMSLNLIQQFTNAFRSRLFRNLALTMALFFILVELLVLVASIRTKGIELQEIRSQIESEISSTGIQLQTLNEKDIQNRINIFIRNVTFLILIIILGVVAGMAASYHFIVGRHLNLLVEVNRGTTRGQVINIPVNQIPDNEIGEVMKGRESILNELLEFQTNLEKKLRSSEDQLIKSAKLGMVGEVASSVAHDLRNPLSVISGYSEYLKELVEAEQPDLNEIKDCAKKIEFATERVDLLMNRMNEFNHQKGSLKVKTSLQVPISNALLFLESKLDKFSVKVEVKDHDLMAKQLIFADLAKIEQVFANLISNAADALKNAQNKKIVIWSKAFESSFIIQVQDFGSGIKKENIESIFDAFYTTKIVGEGTGFGLSIVKTILEEHQGDISVDSEINVGTTFTIRLPQA